MPARATEERFAPLAAELRGAVGREVRLRTASNFDRFFERLSQGEYDIAIVQPFDYVRLAAESYVPVARFSSELHAVIVVNEASEIAKLGELRGRTVALPPERAAVSFLARDMFVGAGLDPSADLNLRYLRDHGTCFQHLAAGQADACVTAELPLARFEKSLKRRFVRLAESTDIPHVALLAHRRLSEEQRDALKKVAIGLSGTDSGRVALEGIGIAGFSDASKEDYDVVRELLRRSQGSSP